jgi:hypothetical protein
LIDNVLNDPANPADAVFSYPCGGCAVQDLQQVLINLRVQSYRRDQQTGQFRQITLVELAQRMNPKP